MGLAAVYELECAENQCDTQGFGLAGIVFGAWGTVVPMTIAGVELTRMNRMRRDSDLDPLTSAKLVLPSVGVTVAAFSLYPLDPPAPGVAALIQVGGASFALVNAVIAIGNNDRPFADGKHVGLRVEPLADSGLLVAISGSL